MNVACHRCGVPFTPRHARHRHCPACEDTGREHRSPTTQAQDPEYRRNRATLLANAPACAIRTHCDGAPATTADHIVAVTHWPQGKPGMHALTNLQPACQSCNAAKGAGSPPARPRLRTDAAPSLRLAAAVRLA